MIIERDGCTDVVTFDNFEDFYKEVIDIHGNIHRKIFSIVSGKFIFRGHASDKYKLLPKVLRENEYPYLVNMGLKTATKKKEYYLIEFERHLLNKFYSTSNDIGLPVPDMERFKGKLGLSDKQTKISNKWINNEYIELAIQAQHYGLHTRLLDWTYDFWVAVYFSIIDYVRSDFDKSSESECFAIWCMDYSNLLLTQITGNMFNFERLQNLYIVREAFYKNRNMSAQKGLFTFWQVEQISSVDSKIDVSPLDELIQLDLEISPNDSPIFYKLIIPKMDSHNLYKLLHNNGYSTARLFPDYNYIKQSIEDECKFINKIVPS